MVAMDIRIEQFDLADPLQIGALVKWDCDKDLYHLTRPARDKSSALNYPSKEEVLRHYQDPSSSKGIYIIWDGDKPVGNFSIQVDPPQVMKKVTGTSWLGLIIGEKGYWGTGVAAAAMAFFEQESLRMGLCRAELGVFEFNTRAQRFYKKLGYNEIGRLKDFTYYDGRFWEDIRMEKFLVAGRP